MNYLIDLAKQKQLDEKHSIKLIGMRKILLFILFSASLCVSAQQKYSFGQKRFEVFEPIGNSDSIFNISISNNLLLEGAVIDTLMIIEYRSGDAGPRDFKLAATLPLLILAHKGSQEKIEFFLHVKHDTIPEKDEDLQLILQFKGKNTTGMADSIIRDTASVIIKEIQNQKKKDKAQEKLEKLQNSNYTNTFLLKDTIYKLEIKDEGENSRMEICKTKDNGLSKDTCQEAMIKTEIEEAEFMFYFKRLLTKVGTLDSTFEKGVSISDKKSSRLYLEWKHFVASKKENISTTKEEIDNSSKINSFQDSLLSIVNLFRLAYDTSYSYIASTMKDVQLHYRRIVEQADTVTGVVDPITVIYNYIQYYPFAGSNISFDSIGIRIDNGFLERVVLYPSSESRTKYTLNYHTTIRKHYDLRNTTDVADVLNMYLPLESTRAYVHLVSDTNDLKQVRLRPRGFKDFKSKDSPRSYYYSGLFVRLGDVIQYNANPDSLPDVLRNVKNINLTFRKDKPLRVNLKERDFNSFSQLNIYTDLIGLSEDKPNGIIQAEGKFETGIFSQPVGNRSYYSKVKVKLLPSASSTFAITKVENKLRYYNVPKSSVVLFNETSNKFDDTVSHRKYIRGIDILQFASLLLNARFNLISIESDFAQAKFYIEGGIIRTPINDTTIGKDNLGNTIVSDSKTVINSLRTAWGILLKLKSNSRLGVDLGLEWMRSTLNNTLLTHTYTAYDKGKRKEVLKETRFRSYPSFRPQIMMPNAEIYYFLDKDFQNRLYLRGKYFKELKSRSDNLFFIQFGYSTDLKGFFGLFKKSAS